jgi:small conductance mechanosensitive channel
VLPAALPYLPAPTFLHVSGTDCPAPGGLSVCTLVRDATGNVRLGLWADVLLGVPLKIIGIVLLGLLSRFIVFRVLHRVTEGIATGKAGLGRFDRLPNATALLTTSPLLSARREQRARTMGSVLKSVTTGVMAAVVLLMTMQVLGLPIAPLLTGAGIVGVAFGFGSQALVKDFLSGIFMIAEDQYGVGDVVDLGDASGVVEAVGLRVTRLRDTEGTVWYLRNGQIQRVGNRSQGWARAVLDIQIAYDEDVSRAQDALLGVARDLQADPAFAGVVLEDPEVWGIESFTAESVVLRLVVKTQPLEQWKVARELRRRIKDRFNSDGILVARPPVAPGSGPGSGPGSAAGSAAGGGGAVG